MSIKKVLLAFVLLFSSVFSTSIITSCSGEVEGTSAQTIVLNDVEDEVYRAVKNSLTSFKNSSSVTVISVGEEEFIGRYIKKMVLVDILLLFI